MSSISGCTSGGQKRARGEVIIVRYADDAVLGFEHRKEAEHSSRVAGADAEVRAGATPGEDATDRVRAFRSRKPRSGEEEGKPETFNFLGFTHICGKTRKSGWFTVHAKTIRKRLAAKLRAAARGASSTLARAGRRDREMVEVGRTRLLQLSRSSRQYGEPGSFRTQVIWYWQRRYGAAVKKAG